MTRRQRATSSVPVLKRTGTGFLPPLQPLDIAHTPRVGNGTRLDAVDKGDALRLACHLSRHEVQEQRRSSTLRLTWPQAWAETHASSHGPRWAVGPGGAFPRTAPNCEAR